MCDALAYITTHGIIIACTYFWQVREQPRCKALLDCSDGNGRHAASEQQSSFEEALCYFSPETAAPRSLCNAVNASPSANAESRPSWRRVSAVDKQPCLSRLIRAHCTGVECRCSRRLLVARHMAHRLNKRPTGPVGTPHPGDGRDAGAACSLSRASPFRDPPKRACWTRQDTETHRRA
ncbi:hypothetical protein HPB51_019224 [Rhipicephalus microplus]|uniref:Uncharacterized protein n=1 Tax=Rhipicephalus microplus TaxID=6941 RepID=A0A9J6DB05_RHIMP|nr:hypothetical protein HPB51_019224 [Rhipicephalus microplus]